VAVLVIGGAGYIGSHTARLLKQYGYEVLIYDNLSTGFPFLAKGFELITGDVTDRQKLSEAMRRTDAVIHFAAHSYVGESVENPRKYFRNNVEGGLALLNTAIEVGLRKVIFSSTCAVYGVPAKIPIVEDTPRQALF
jgi:UDP-glucose 4-epimerase